MRLRLDVMPASRKGRRFGGPGVIAIVFLFIFILLMNRFSYSRMRGELEKTMKEIEKVISMKNQYQEMVRQKAGGERGKEGGLDSGTARKLEEALEKFEMLFEFSQARGGYSKFFQLLEGSLPDEAWLSSIKEDPEGHFIIAGQAASSMLALEIVERLTERGAGEVAMTKCISSGESLRKKVDFEIEFFWKHLPGFSNLRKEDKQLAFNSVKQGKKSPK